MPDRWVSRFSAVRSAVRMPAVGPARTSAGFARHQRRRRPAPTDRLGRSNRAPCRTPPCATGPPASTPACRGVMLARLSWSVGTVASVVTSGPSRRSSVSARSMTAATWSADNPAAAIASRVCSVRPMRPPGRGRPLGIDDAVDLPDQHRTLPGPVPVRVIIADMAAAGLGARLRRRPAARIAASARFAVSTDQRSAAGAGAAPSRRRSTARPAGRPGRGRCRRRGSWSPASRTRPAGSAPGTGVRISSARPAGGQRHLDADRGGGPLPHHQALQQRVRRQPVRAVQPGPGDLADREQARAPWCARPGRSARRRSGSARPGRPGSGRCRVDAGQRAGRGHRREAAGEDGRRDAGRVQEDMVADAARRRAIRRETASDTTSRGARSASGCTPSMIRAPAPSISTAPSPRTASVTSGRWPRSPGPVHSTVGWNCMNSTSARAAPARSAIASPSPVATPGLVVAAYRWPAPPVASTTARAADQADRAVRSQHREPASPAGAVQHDVERLMSGQHRRQPAGPPAARARSPRRWRHRRHG